MKRIGLGPAPDEDRQRMLAKRVGQGTNGSEQKIEICQGDTLSEDRPIAKRKSIPRYGARSGLFSIMSQIAPEIGLRSRGEYIPLRRRISQVLNACTAEVRLSARPLLQHSSDPQ